MLERLANSCAEAGVDVEEVFEPFLALFDAGQALKKKRRDVT
jgi:hypothetical protein